MVPVTIHAVHYIDYHNSSSNCNCCFAIGFDDLAKQVFVDEQYMIMMPADGCNSAFGVAFGVDLDWFVKRHV